MRPDGITARAVLGLAPRFLGYALLLTAWVCDVAGEALVDLARVLEGRS